MIRILIVEDSPVVQRTLTMLLANEPGLARRLTQRALEHVTQTYSEEATLTQISETLMAVCER